MWSCRRKSLQQQSSCLAHYLPEAVTPLASDVTCQADISDASSSTHSSTEMLTEPYLQGIGGVLKRLLHLARTKFPKVT